MNGTWAKFAWFAISGLLAVLFSMGGFWVQSVEKRLDLLYDIRDRLARIEAKLQP